MDNSVKQKIAKIIREAAEELFSCPAPPFALERPKNKKWGDLSTNLPFLLASSKNISPQVAGEKLVPFLSGNSLFSKVDFAPPGFLNFFLSSFSLQESLKKIVKEEEGFTLFSLGQHRPVQVEFVSANPTGPLHVGHGRAAALGDALANNLEKLGFKVEREYYINDVGGQIERLANSLFIRLRQFDGERVEIPEDGYKGEYLIDIARIFREKWKTLKDKKEKEILNVLSEFVVKEILSDIKSDLERFGVKYDRWFFESELYQRGEVEEILDFLKEKGFIYQKDGALWFKTSLFLEGQEDRVLRKKNGEYTYFASDIAYHKNKLKRGFYRVVDIWGADHIGYVPRMMAAAKAIGYPNNALKILIYQLVTIKRGGKRVSASTRKGQFISLRELLDEVGKDAARFFFLSRSADSHLEFDLELAKKQTPENPVFYVQYAHARICSILRKAKEKGFDLKETPDLRLLDTREERDLMLLITLLPDGIKEAGERLEPHHLTGYAMEIASAFHYFYTRHRVIDEENKPLSFARLYLARAVKIALQDILSILGISAPEKM